MPLSCQRNKTTTLHHSRQQLLLTTESYTARGCQCLCPLCNMSAERVRVAWIADPKKTLGSNWLGVSTTYFVIFSYYFDWHSSFLTKLCKVWKETWISEAQPSGSLTTGGESCEAPNQSETSEATSVSASSCSFRVGQGGWSFVRLTAAEVKKA